MASPTPNKGYTYPAHGGAVNAWDTPLNTNFDYIDLNIGGAYPITISSTTAAATFNSSAATIASSITSATIPTSLAENLFYPVSGTMGANLSLVYPAAGGLYLVSNNSSGAFSLSVTTASSIAVPYTVRQGGVSVIVTDGITAYTNSNSAAVPVTYAQMQTQASNTLLGNVSSATGVPQAITIGSGLTATSSNTTLAVTGFAPPTSFKNLSIKVATNTTVAVAADFVTMTNGPNYITAAVNATCNLGISGAINALDAGAIAAASWYAIWVITDGTTVATLASLSGTAPTMPAGYTYKARMGWVRTAPAVAQLLGTWQFGKKTQYVVGLAQTTAAIIITNANTGVVSSPSTAVSISNMVPTTASEIHIYYNGLGSTCIAAPNPNYGAYNSATNCPPVVVNGIINCAVSTFILESTNIYFGSNGSCLMICLGWTDNL